MTVKRWVVRRKSDGMYFASNPLQAWTTSLLEARKFSDAECDGCFYSDLKSGAGFMQAVLVRVTIEEEAAPPTGDSGLREAGLTERRAKFVYEGTRIAAISAKAPIVPVPWNQREADFRAQFLNVIDRQCGPERSSSPEELHRTWMDAYLKNGWQYGEKYDRENRIHPDLVPYDELGQLEKDKDAVFVALCEIARLFIYDVSFAPRKEGEG